MKPQDEYTLWPAAFRYYLGRSTHAVSNFCNLLIRNWPTLSDATRNLIVKELEREFAKDDDARKHDRFRPLGHDMDREEWQKVRALWRVMNDANPPVEAAHTDANGASLCDQTPAPPVESDTPAQKAG